MGASNDAVPRRAVRRRPLTVVLVTLGVLLAIVVAGSAALYKAAEETVTASVPRASGLLPSEPTRTPGTASSSADSDTKAATKPLNILLLGTDNRYDGNGGRSDAIIVMHISGDRRHVSLVSFARDLYVPIPGYGKNKINAAMAFGGPALTVRTIQDLTGIHIDHVALIDMEGFIALADEVGGVEVYNRHASVSRGHTFPKGRITLNGDQALAYVRERKALPRGDLDRTERQRAVLLGIAGKLVSRETLRDPRRLPGLISRVGEHVQVDDTWTSAQMLRLAASMRHLDRAGMHSLEVPVSGFGTGPGGMAIDILDRPGLAKLSAALRNDTVHTYRGS